jgi:predicted SAM-dependent methyltransferase
VNGRKKLHVGCGTNILPGWVNIDIEALPGVDFTLDVRVGRLPFDQVALIFAEHFIEHLDFHDGLGFLRECRRVLTDDGVLRLSTPNLDWVWRHQYHYGSWQEESEAIRDCFWMNKAFRGWGHQFLYNAQTLTEVLREAGFGRIEATGYGDSRFAELRGLERHEKYVDSPDLPHVIVVEASGRSDSSSGALRGPRADFEQAMGIRPPGKSDRRQ